MEANHEMPWPPFPLLEAPSRRNYQAFLATFAVATIALALGGVSWRCYVAAPSTRDATIRADVATLAPEVAGRVVRLHVRDNQFVHQGDLLMEVDPTDYRLALQMAEAAVQQAKATAENARQQAERRRALSDLAVSAEDRQGREANALAADAQYQQALAKRDQAKVNLSRTEIRAPVTGWITNLTLRSGNYVTIGRNVISVIDANSFWVDAYFEETQLATLQEGDPAQIKLMGYDQTVQGTVGSVARGIAVNNAQPDHQGLAFVNPVFAWVRLAQRVPVRIAIHHVPEGVRLVAGTSATVQLRPSH
ncbi:multidrug resistance efflux pump [Bradyrhizobium sp. USDA 4518]